jgi:hypothetical protein
MAAFEGQQKLQILQIKPVMTLIPSIGGQGNRGGATSVECSAKRPKFIISLMLIFSALVRLIRCSKACEIAVEGEMPCKHFVHVISWVAGIV